MNSAYFSSLSFTSSSTRIWMVADLGCLGGAFRSGKYCSPFSIQIVRLRVCQTLGSVACTRPKQELRFQQHEAGVTPEARRDRGREFAARWGRSRLSSCFGRVLVHPVLLVHLVVSSAAYVSARVTLGVKSPAKGRLFILFLGDFTKLFGCRS